MLYDDASNRKKKIFSICFSYLSFYWYERLILNMFLLHRWVLIKKKQYQAKDDTVESSVLTKVKGVARVNTTASQLWGPEDYVHPKQVSQNTLSSY